MMQGWYRGVKALKDNGIIYVYDEPDVGVDFGKKVVYLGVDVETKFGPKIEDEDWGTEEF